MILAENKKISIFIDRFLPDHIKENDENFRTFVLKFLQYLESPDKPYNIVSRLIEYSNIDPSLTRFFEHHHTHYLRGLPSSYKTDLQLFFRNIHDFVISRGTEDSYKYLFRALYDEDISFYYPRKDILRCSDGKWVEPTQLIVRNGFGLTVPIADMKLWVGKTIIGETSSGSGIVDHLDNIPDPAAPANNIWVLNVLLGTSRLSVGEQIRDSVGELGNLQIISINNLAGSWHGTDGFLNSKKKLQDNNYYQDHSYQISSSITRDQYWEILRKNLHPAGFRFFGNVVSNKKIKINATSLLNAFRIEWKTTSPIGFNVGQTKNKIVSFSQISAGTTYRMFEMYREQKRYTAYSNVGSIDNIQINDFVTNSTKSIRLRI